MKIPKNEVLNLVDQISYRTYRATTGQVLAIPRHTLHRVYSVERSKILQFSTKKGTLDGQLEQGEDYKTLSFEDGHHVILKGASGNGKIYLACALGNAACRKFSL